MKPTEKSGEWKGGVWTPKINNPTGFNRYKKNPTPAPEKKSQIEQFAGLPSYEQKEIIAKLGNDIYNKTREIRPLVRRFKVFKDYYERQHFGWKWEE